jgi:hypothetical protein
MTRFLVRTGFRSGRALAVAASCLFLVFGLAVPANAAPPFWDPLPSPEERNLHWTCGPVERPESDDLAWVRACVVVNDNSHAQAWAVAGNNDDSTVLKVDKASVNLHDLPDGPVISHSACGELFLSGAVYAGCANPTVAPSCGSNVYAKVSVWIAGVPLNPPPASRFVPCG